MDEVKCKIKEKKVEKGKISMSATSTHAPDIVIPRTFRWTMANEKYPDIHWWMQSIKTDYVNKKIIIELFDDAKGAVFEWLQALAEEKKDANSVVLTHLDGCGTAIALINFFGLKLEEHNTNYDYSSSEILTHKVAVSYKKIERVNQSKIT